MEPNEHFPSEPARHTGRYDELSVFGVSPAKAALRHEPGVVDLNGACKRARLKRSQTQLELLPLPGEAASRCDGPGRATLLSQEAVLTEASGNMDDKDVIAAMNRAVTNLAGQIAAGIPRSSSRARHR